MSKGRRTRQLSSEEKRLWSHVARNVKPMKGKLPPPEPEPEEKPATAPAPLAVAPRLPPLPPPAKPAMPPLAPVERKTLQALRRGRKDVDSVIDLHGMRQERGAFRAPALPPPGAKLRLRARSRHHRQGRRGGRVRHFRGARGAAAHGAALAAPARSAAPGDRLRGGLSPAWRIRCTLCQAPPPAGCGIGR